MVGLTMGSGDTWPEVELGKVVFAQNGFGHVATALDIQGDALASLQQTGIFGGPSPTAKATPLPKGCAALAPGHRRRIFFGFEDVAVDGTFALGYEEVDEKGAVVPGTQKPVSRFNPADDIVCLPLGPGQTPQHEIWELVQLSTENHNFHIHQTRFRVIDPNGPATGLQGLKANLTQRGAGMMQDNVALGVAVPGDAIASTVNDQQSGVCTADQWRSGQCSATPVVVDIAFSQLGEFVYHCHILEHEDGGMMAKIRVVAAPQ
jgi:plastocyanin